MRLPVFALIVLVGACGAGGGRIGQLQANCEARYPDFPEMVSCLKSSLIAAGAPNTAQIRLYIATAEELASDVAAGSKTDSRARFELAELYERNRAAQRAARDRAVDRRQQGIPQRYADPTPPGPARLDADAGCYSNLDCPIGAQCMRPGGYGAGVCGRPVDSYGTPTYRPDARGAVCTMDTDCPVSFECRKPSGRYEGICTKRY